MTNKPPTAKQILRNARRYLDNPEHWRKGGYGRVDGAVCMAGALNRAASRGRTVDYVHPPARTELIRARNLLDTVISLPATEFNDHPETTHKDVLAAFDKALEATNGK